MKKMILTFLTICGLIPINNSCSNKEINLIFNNPVEIATDFVSNAFVNESLDAMITYIPKDGEYPVNYSLRYEIEEGEGSYQLFDENFTSEDIHTFENASEILISITYNGSVEGKHKSKWILRNDFDQEFITYIEFDLKKNPEPVINEAPTANIDEFTTKQEVAIVLDVIGNDRDKEDDPLQLIEIGTPENGIAEIQDNKINYTPNNGFVGVDNLSYTIDDGKGNTASSSVTITVIEKTVDNLAPQVENDTLEIEINTETLIGVLVNDNDPEGLILELVKVETPPNGTAIIEGDNIKYLPNLDYEGTDIFNYTVKDPEGLESTGEITITVVNNTPNLAPVAVKDTVETPFETSILIDVVNNDTDNEGEQITLISVDTPTNGTAEIEGDKIRYTPNTGYSGSETFNYTVEDESGNEAIGGIEVTIEEQINLPPVASEDEITVESGVEIVIDVLLNDEDPEGQDLELINVYNSSFAFPRIEDNKIVYQGSVVNETKDTFNYIVADSQGKQTEGTIIVTITVPATIEIVDINLERKLIELNIDSDKTENNKILKSDAEAITELDVSRSNIADMKGIEGFTNLVTLKANRNVFKIIDLSGNTLLRDLVLDRNQLESIDLTKNTELVDVSIARNMLKEIDLSQSSRLLRLKLQDNAFETIDLSGTVNLEELTIFSNNLSSLDLTKNVDLKILSAPFNRIATINLVNNTKLEQIAIHENQLEAIDVSNNPLLTYLSCHTNRIKVIDLLKNELVETLNCQKNELTQLNLRTDLMNGVVINLNATDNPTLTCIQVPNKMMADQITTWQKDASADYSENCN